MRYVIDIDGTICSVTNSDYKNAKPFHDRINRINKLYNCGAYIILFTARGMSTSSKDKYTELTVKQLKSWNVKYDELIFGKPAGDIYIDDKGVSAIEFFKD